MKSSLAILLALVCVAVVVKTCYSQHFHEHGMDEKPSFKYSKEANQQGAAGHGHAHSHGGHGHGHAHSHGGHGHAHGGHGHSHGGHGHSHGGAASSHGHSHDDHDDEVVQSRQQRATSEEDKLSKTWSVAAKALIATALISIAPFVILFFVPLNNNSAENQPLLRILLSLASGSLLGDSFLHLIPHALHPHSHDGDDHGHSHADEHDHSAQTAVGLWVLAGITVFLLVEKLVRHIKGDSHTHTHSHDVKPKKSDEKCSDDEDSKKKKEEKSPKSAKKGQQKEKKKAAVEEEKADIAVAGYLNLAADFAHNFTDGLAIGASFLTGHGIGIITTVTIFLHEIPHEIGDFAILIQSGCSKRKAMLLQLVTAFGAVCGTLLSLLFESAVSGIATSCILPFTAGGFIYIATVSIIPELKENTSIFQSIKEIIALVIGVFSMVLIAYLE